MKVGDKIILYNALCKIQRPVRIKRINSNSVILDYGEDSNFDIKYSFKTAKPLNSVRAWDDFDISFNDLEQLKLVAQESSERSNT